MIGLDTRVMTVTFERYRYTAVGFPYVLPFVIGRWEKKSE